MATYEKIRIQQKAYPAAEWVSKYSNHILLNREIGYETDTGKYKMGDGATPWASLSYYNSDLASGTPIVQFTAHPDEAASGPIYYGTSNEIKQIYNGLEILACFDGYTSVCGMLYLNSTETCHGSGYVKNNNPTSMVLPLLNITANRVMRLRYRSDVSDSVFGQAGGCWICMDPVYDYSPSGVLPIECGGTGASDVSLARYNLGITSITNIYSGSYTGTGTYGSSNLNKLAFGSAPKLVVISSDGATLIMIRGCTRYSIEYGNHWYSGNITWSDSSVSWFGNDAINQFNSSGQKYNYVAIG